MPTEPPQKPRPRANLPPPEPLNHKVFDTWNSSSTGHQRAENPYSNTTAWRDTRSQKLARQFKSGDCMRGPRVTTAQAFDGTCGPDPVDCGAGAGISSDQRTSDTGAWTWVSDAEATRAQLGVRDIRSFMGVSKRKAVDGEQDRMGKKRYKQLGKEEGLDGAKVKADDQISRHGLAGELNGGSISMQTMPTNEMEDSGDLKQDLGAKSKIFAGTNVYINGSTLPQISDHKLKQLLVAHGAQISISMMRKKVSHIIVGQPNSASTKSSSMGAGGGLAAGKLQQEIARGGWKGVKVTGVDWALESIKAGRRLAESRFAVLQVAPKRQRSVIGMFGNR